MVRHRAISLQRYDEAQANLNTASKALAVYQEISPDEHAADVAALAKDIEEVQQKIAHLNPSICAEGSRRVETALQRMLHMFGRRVQPTPPQPNAESASRANPNQ